MGHLPNHNTAHNAEVIDWWMLQSKGAIQMFGLLLCSQMPTISQPHCFAARSQSSVHYTLCSEKTPTHVFDYNSGVSVSIYIVFVPVERAMNTLQFTYLQSWWRHNGVTLHVTKVYFIELLLNININILSLKFSFKDKNLRKKTLKMWKFFLPKTDKKFCTKIQFKKMKIKRLFAKFANNWYRSNALPKW